MTTDYLRLMLDESRDIADFLETLTPAEWDSPSLCRGWRVRDVVAHMAVGHTMPVVAFGAAALRHRFNIDATSFVLAKDFADAHRPEQILALFRKGTAGRPRAAARFVPVHELLTDHLVHHQDMRRPLGLPRVVPADRALAALHSLRRLSSRVGSRARMKGLHLVATDADFELGVEGLQVQGTSEALLMALTGRGDVLGELDGPGVGLLAGRLQDGGTKAKSA